MSITVSKIRKNAGASWLVLPTAMTIIPTRQVLDASTSGRDPNTGIMYRDIVRSDVATYSCTLPEGITNQEMAVILDIILGASFQMNIPNISSGAWETRTFYCATASPEIKTIYSDTTQPLWEYEEFTFEAIQI